MKLKLAPENDPILRRIATHVKDIDHEVKPVAKKMRKLMRKKRGIGLAAPQVGIGLRFFVTGLDTNSLRVCINPSFAPTTCIGTEYVNSFEGCLSFPNNRVDVRRLKTIDATWTDVNGYKKTKILTGYESRVFQHECDHLDGINIVDK